MVDPSAPDEVVTLAEERALARLERDWPRADELKARIEAAGWTVVDEGPAFSLRPSRSPDLLEEGQTWYGALDSVPSRLEEAAATEASVIVVADAASSTAAVLEALHAHRSGSLQVLVVAPRSVTVSGPHDEAVRTVEPFSAGDALQAGLRRATGEIAVVLDPGRLPAADVIGPLVEALRDPEVAFVGADGLVSSDLHHYRPAHGAVTTLASGCYAFRRSDAVARGPVDGRLRLPASVAMWLGLLLRDEGEGVPPRRALAIDLPLSTAPEPTAEEDARAARRDGYRIADRFRGAPWLAGEPPDGRVVGHGAEQDERADHEEQAGQARET